VARYGGEEFVAVLSGTDLPGARTMAERMLQRVRDLELAHDCSEVGRCVTISAGISAIQPNGGANSVELILAADQALYLAKSRGRNRAEVVEN
jgi:diguanylate cyclase (GGDEF)-like protein